MKIVSGLREQWIITLALAPLTLLFFGQVSLVSLVANAVAIPWITLVVTPLGLLGVLLPPLWDVAALALGGLLPILHALAAWPWAALSLAVPPTWTVLAAVPGAMLLLLRLPWSVRLLGWPLLLPSMLWRVALPAPGQFELLAADIGQGSAVLVRTRQHALLFDAGPRYSLESDAGHRVLVPLLQALRTRLDLLVLSHRDVDHMGGAAAVLQAQPQAAVLGSMAAHTLPGVRVQRCLAGQRWHWDGVDFEMLHPQAIGYDDRRTSSNALSCVLRIDNGRHSALLVGDIEQAQEQQLLDSGAARRATVLLVPHHGSASSSSAQFVAAVAPELALVQAGYRNRFGHPAPAVVERYRTQHATLLAAPACGAMTWQSWRWPAPTTDTCWRLQQRRYWHHRLPLSE